MKPVLLPALWVYSPLLSGYCVAGSELGRVSHGAFIPGSFIYCMFAVSTVGQARHSCRYRELRSEFRQGPCPQPSKKPRVAGGEWELSGDCETSS